MCYLSVEVNFWSYVSHLHITTLLIRALPSASCSEPTWDSLPWPSRLSERALWTSPLATWIILWAFCCARLSARWTCLLAWRPSTCRCGRASQAPCSWSASWCTCSTGSTLRGYLWEQCLRPRFTIPCGLCTAPLCNKVSHTDRRVSRLLCKMWKWQQHIWYVLIYCGSV